jgi:hypothetical protein
MSIRFIALAMVLNSVVSIVAWESMRPIPARAQAEAEEEACDEKLDDFQVQVSKCLEEATSLTKARDCWEM